MQLTRKRRTKTNPRTGNRQNIKTKYLRHRGKITLNLLNNKQRVVGWVPDHDTAPKTGMMWWRLAMNQTDHPLFLHPTLGPSAWQSWIRNRSRRPPGHFRHSGRGRGPESAPAHAPSRTNLPLPSRPGSALRHWEVADWPEVADSVDARVCPQKTADIDSLRYSPDDPHYGLGPVHTSLYVRVTWDWWLGHLPRSPGTGEGEDWWSWRMGVKAEGTPRVC